jgi:hypothetical protein
LTFGNGARREWCQRCVFKIPQMNCASLDTIFRKTVICISSSSRERGKLKTQLIRVSQDPVLSCTQWRTYEGSSRRNRREQCLPLCLWHDNLALFPISTSTPCQFFPFLFSLRLFTRIDSQSQVIRLQGAILSSERRVFNKRNLPFVPPNLHFLLRFQLRIKIRR